MTDSPLGTMHVAQIGIVVKDLEAVSRAWAELAGVPVPSIGISGEWADAQTTYEGAPTPARVKQAFIRMDAIDIELLEPVDRPSTWDDQLEQVGSSLHHIAFRIEGMGDKLAWFDAHGMPLIQRGQFKGGCYAYVDSADQLGGIVELLEHD
jgi:methylmalonyl-CoA/ethylmalonyl-CoA epimerase